MQIPLTHCDPCETRAGFRWVCYLGYEWKVKHILQSGHVFREAIGGSLIRAILVAYSQGIYIHLLKRFVALTFMIQIAYLCDSERNSLPSKNFPCISMDMLQIGAWYY